jgi:molybdopterin-containing oxidoreductase family iron-sulfur binding subunit
MSGTGSDRKPRVKITRRQLFTAAAAVGAAATLPSLVARSRPAAGSQPGKVSRQWAMVIDLRKCEGCTTINKPPQCVAACQKTHSLPEGQQWIRVVTERDERGTFFRPIPCMQCENAPCVQVCPVGANFHDAGGVVLVDQNRCIGCRLCMAACPYDVRVFNWTQPANPPGAALATYSPEFPLPHRKGTVSKCMLCAHRTAHGELPACASGCPMKAIYLGDLVSDVATNGDEVVQLSAFLNENHATRYKSELGTHPRVYYIPGHGEAFGRRAAP